MNCSQTTLIEDIDRPRKRCRPTEVMDSIALLTQVGISSYLLGDHVQAEKCFSEALCRVDINFLYRQVESMVADNAKDAVVVDMDAQNRSEYDEGMKVFDGPLPLHKSSETIVVSTLFYNIAQIYIRRGLYQDAKEWLHKSLDDCSASEATSSVLAVKILHSLGYCNYRTGKDEQALTFYQQALLLVSDLNLGETLLAASLNCIGVLFFNQQPCNTESAMDMFCQSLELYRSLKNTSLVSIATVLNNIGRVLYLRSEFTEALAIYEESLQIRKQLLGADSIDVAATVYNIGQTCHQLGQHDESLAHYKDFLRIAQLAFGPQSRDVALVYKGIAEIHHERSDLKMSLYYYTQALEVQRVSGCNFNTDVATTLNKLGNLCYEMKDFSTAMKHYKEGLQVERKVLSPGHPHIIITMTNIAHIHKQLGEHAKALMAYEKVRTMQENTFGNECMQLAETLSSIGLMQYHLRDFEASFDSYQAALRIRRQQLGSEDHPDVASTLNSIGLVLFKQDMFELAKKCFTESLRIRSKVLGKDHRDVAILWYNIATIHFETGEDDLAIQMYKETLRVERNALGNDHTDVVLTLQHLGQVHQQLGQFEVALGYFQEALDIERNRQQQQGHSASGTCLGRILNLLGNVYLQLGQTKKMMDCYVEASRMYDANPQAGEALVMAGYNFYGLSKTNPRCAPIA